MDKSKPKPNQGSSWKDEHERKNRPDRRQDDDSNVESPPTGQRASRTDVGSSESLTDRGESESESLDYRERDRSRNKDVTE